MIKKPLILLGDILLCTGLVYGQLENTRAREHRPGGPGKHGTTGTELSSPGTTAAHGIETGICDYINPGLRHEVLIILRSALAAAPVKQAWPGKRDNLPDTVKKEHIYDH